MGPPWITPWTRWLFLLLCVPAAVWAGCYRERLCCVGRNVSCKAKDDGFDSFPVVTSAPPVKLVRFRDEEYPPVLSESGERIGRLILPGMVEIDESKLDLKDRFGHAEFLTVRDGDEYRRKQVVPTRQNAAPIKTLTELIFGYPFAGPESPEETSYESGRPIVRLSTLNRYLPVRVGKILDPHAPVIVDSEEYDEADNYMFLSESDPDCFCDESCVQYGDCCSDYTFVCLPTDCQVSAWSAWSSCQPYQGSCGEGKQVRTRTITTHSAHGGLACPELEENRACRHECVVRRQKDITTTALLLPYKYRHARSHYKHPKKIIPARNHTNYCVKYRLGWVNRNCVHPFKKQLVRGHEICAECQPEAQYHRYNPRCASDLEDGEKGSWKLIGPLSCYGLWVRESRVDNCSCASDATLRHLEPFLMV